MKSEDGGRRRRSSAIVAAIWEPSQIALPGSHDLDLNGSGDIDRRRDEERSRGNEKNRPSVRATVVGLVAARLVRGERGDRGLERRVVRCSSLRSVCLGQRRNDVVSVDDRTYWRQRRR